ncbi:MAG TPA: MopE-related protein [Candidatus Polarisedimenticolia bacterium]|nr:MopE-related protein [Candidatus Polarisedimenticolia bacterium]
MLCSRLQRAALILALAGVASGAAHAATVVTYSSESAFLAALGPAAGRATFDGYAPGTVFNTQITGLTFSSPNAGLAGSLPVQVAASSGSVSSPNLLAGSYVPGSPGLAEVLVVDFAPDVLAYGGYVSPLTPDSVAVTLKFDFRDATSQTFTVRPGSNNRPEFFGVRSDNGIRRATYSAIKANNGQQGFKHFGVDNLAWIATDARPPICSAEKSILNNILGFDGTSTDNAAFDTGVLSVTLQNASNVHLTCAAPLPAGCGSAANPTPIASWRVEPTDPGLDGSGSVRATDAAGNACTFDVTFSAFGGGGTNNLVVCRDTGLVLSVSNPTASDAGQIICSSTLPGPNEPPYPAGYEPSPVNDPSACTIFTIKSPIHGDTIMVLKKDFDFEPRLRLLFSRFDGATFPPFADVTTSVDQVTTIIPDPTRVQGGGKWSQVKVACAVLAETCNGVDDDGDGQVDEGFNPGGPAKDCDRDGYPQCVTGATTADDCNGGTVNLVPGATADCNDQNGAIHAGASETCNGVDDDCDGVVDDGQPEGGAACEVPGLLGACAEGVTSCSAGPMVCSQVHQPVAETCNDIDDDCDGQVDEGNPPGGDACTIEGLLGVCAHGVISCATGSRACAQTAFPTAEACNGLDDDCDGATDEDFGTVTCGVGACAASVNSCVGGLPQTCVPGTPGLETCNGADDDCDGATDEGFGTSTCGVGSCRTTVNNCSGGHLQTCTPAAPSEEICNGQDDDCDGATDESYIFSGYLAPVRADGSGIYQAGRTLPLKFRLTNCGGANFPGASATVAVLPYGGFAGTVEVANLSNNKASTGNTYVYDAKTNMYTYNLGTSNLVSGRSYVLRTTVSDGSVHDVVISIR